jgi:hypothetical protein
LPDFGDAGGYQPKYKVGTNLTGAPNYFSNMQALSQAAGLQGQQAQASIFGSGGGGEGGTGEGSTAGTATGGPSLADFGKLALGAMLGLSPQALAIKAVQMMLAAPPVTQATDSVVGGATPGGGDASDAEGEAAAAGQHGLSAAEQADAQAAENDAQHGFGGSGSGPAGTGAGGPAGGGNPTGSGATGTGPGVSGMGASGDSSPSGVSGTGGGGGGGGSGGKIVCTALNDMYGFGSYRNKIWLEYDAKIGSKLPNADILELGYHKLFMPLAKSMHKYPLMAQILRRIVTVRSARCRNELRGQPTTLEQKAYKLLFETPCKVAGWLVKKGFLKQVKI